MIIQFRIVDRALSPLIGLNDSEILKLIELLRRTLPLYDQLIQVSLQQPLRGQKQLTMESILTNYPKIFDDSVGKFESTLHL